MAGVRAQRTTLTSSNETVSVFNKYGVCTKKYKKSILILIKGVLKWEKLK